MLAGHIQPPDWFHMGGLGRGPGRGLGTQLGTMEELDIELGGEHGCLQCTRPLVCLSSHLPSADDGCFTSDSQSQPVTTLNLQETHSGKQSQTNNSAKLAIACILHVEVLHIIENFKKIINSAITINSQEAAELCGEVPCTFHSRSPG